MIYSPFRMIPIMKSLIRDIRSLGYWRVSTHSRTRQQEANSKPKKWCFECVASCFLSPNSTHLMTDRFQSSLGVAIFSKEIQRLGCNHRSRHFRPPTVDTYTPLKCCRDSGIPILCKNCILPVLQNDSKNYTPPISE